MLRCQVCCSLEPRRFPKVCLEVDHFLEEKFPKEYSLRRDAVKEVLIKHDTASCMSHCLALQTDLTIHLSLLCAIFLLLMIFPVS